MMSGSGTQAQVYTEQMIEGMRRDVRKHLLAARREGDRVRVRRLEAMKRVIDNRLIPLACPDAVTIAGDTAVAAHHGQSELDWRRSAQEEANHHGRNTLDMDVAVRILKAADMWPWPV
jgi:hypothetical protein